ncbi:MAG: CPBP family intramembrane metalloprotease [Firmicutes bacterium]|jgi:membrane protease YdiL (CAAX protease family)|nr:CPBP family intramembrane metalloprotease [Bacillota bacterium]
MDVLGSLVSSVVQVVIFSAVPFVWWAVTERGRVPFFKWVGLKRPALADKQRAALVIGAAVVFSVSMQFVIPHLVETDDTAVSAFVGRGMAAFVPALLFAFISTGLSEEILFRGFLGKRLVAQHGFVIGNIVQAFVFGLIHGILFWGKTGTLVSALIAVVTGFTGWLMGYVNERIADGSIVPSWMIHGISNMLSALFVMF